jgi:hypothetical protein
LGGFGYAMFALGMRCAGSSAALALCGVAGTVQQRGIRACSCEDLALLLGLAGLCAGPLRFMACICSRLSVQHIRLGWASAGSPVVWVCVGPAAAGWPQLCVCLLSLESDFTRSTVLLTEWATLGATCMLYIVFEGRRCRDPCSTLWHTDRQHMSFTGCSR